MSSRTRRGSNILQGYADRAVDDRDAGPAPAAERLAGLGTLGGFATPAAPAAAGLGGSVRGGDLGRRGVHSGRGGNRPAAPFPCRPCLAAHPAWPAAAQVLLDLGGQPRARAI